MIRSRVLALAGTIACTLALAVGGTASAAVPEVGDCEQARAAYVGVSLDPKADPSKASDELVRICTGDGDEIEARIEVSDLVCIRAHVLGDEQLIHTHGCKVWRAKQPAPGTPDASDGKVTEAPPTAEESLIEADLPVTG